jgi:hypothetical protein
MVGVTGKDDLAGAAKEMAAKVGLRPGAACGAAPGAAGRPLGEGCWHRQLGEHSQHNCPSCPARATVYHQTGRSLANKRGEPDGAPAPL